MKGIDISVEYVHSITMQEILFWLFLYWSVGLVLQPSFIDEDCYPTNPTDMMRMYLLALLWPLSLFCFMVK